MMSLPPWYHETSKGTLWSAETLQDMEATWPRMTLVSTGGRMICVLTMTSSQASPVTEPASLALVQVYFPRSVVRTLAMSTPPSSKIWMRPENEICPSGVRIVMMDDILPLPEAREGGRA